MPVNKEYDIDMSYLVSMLVCYGLVSEQRWRRGVVHGAHEGSTREQFLGGLQTTAASTDSGLHE